MNAHTIRDRAGNPVRREHDGIVERSSDQPGAVGKHIDSYTRPYRFAEEYQRPEMLAEEVKAQAYLDLAIRALVYFAISIVIVFGGLALLTNWEMF